VGELRLQASPGTKVHETTFQWKKLGVVACACHLCYNEKHKTEGSLYKPAQAKSKTLCLNNQGEKELGAWLEQ
jgi:hypothetical protein